MESANESLDGSRCTIIILCKEGIEEYGCSDSGHEHYCRHERSVRKIVRSKVGSKFIILLACGVQKGPLSLTATQLVRATLTR